MLTNPLLITIALASFASGHQRLPTIAAPADAPAVAADRSNPPTVDEWNAQTKEVTVTGSSTLNCETKMVREWLRVSCRGKNKSGGTTNGVVVTKGDNKNDVFTFAGKGVSSLVVRFVEGVDLDATFSWTDGSHDLHVVWAKGSPEPAAKGKFDGV
ncbi:MAG: hypothetical protein U0271_09420 [Polyangiaceae bacterium]